MTGVAGVDAVLAVGGYDTEMPVQGGEDWDLWLSLVERGFRGVIIPEVLFNYRRRAGSLSTIAWNGPGHLPLADYRITKHADLYRMHLFEVLLHQDEETAEVLRANDATERYIASELEPLVAAQRDELSRLRRRLMSAEAEASADPRAEVSRLETALREARAEVAARRSSSSWRLTRPLRDVYAWLLRWGSE